MFDFNGLAFTVGENTVYVNGALWGGIPLVKEFLKNFYGNCSYYEEKVELLFITQVQFPSKIGLVFRARDNACTFSGWRKPEEVRGLLVYLLSALDTV